jgi:protein LSM12
MAGHRMQAMERSVRAIGTDVTEEAQDIFDALAKTMPCEWRGETIEVYGEIQVVSPYSLDDCKFIGGGNGNEMMMDRVKTVLGEELKRQPPEPTAKAAGGSSSVLANGDR